MEIQNKKLINKNKYRNISIITLILTLIFFCATIKELNQSNKQEMFLGLASALTTLTFFMLSLVSAGIAISSFFKYKLSKEHVIIKNISGKVATGVILITVVSLWHLATGLQISITEWIIIGIGIILILLGIFKKTCNDKR